MTPEFWDLLQRWKAGALNDDDLRGQFNASSLTAATNPEARIDFDRLKRCGAPEVVYGPGKSPEVICEIFQRQLQAGQRCLATRVSDQQAAALSLQFPEARFNPLARTVSVIPDAVGSTFAGGKVIVITAGTSDRPVAEEAVETARWLGCEVELLMDIGVAGPLRLLQQLPVIQQAAALVVVAGMEGALPSVVAGWVAVPVIAIPTSVGYGANFAGVTPLLTMLASCAANVAVVNIDAGFKGGYLAGLIARQRVPFE